MLGGVGIGHEIHCRRGWFDRRTEPRVAHHADNLILIDPLAQRDLPRPILFYKAFVNQGDRPMVKELSTRNFATLRYRDTHRYKGLRSYEGVIGQDRLVAR